MARLVRGKGSGVGVAASGVTERFVTARRSTSNSRRVCKGYQPTDPEGSAGRHASRVVLRLLPGCCPAAADVASASRVRPSNHRSGNHCVNCSTVGFSPNANNPGSASRRYTKGSIPRCLHAPRLCPAPPLASSGCSPFAGCTGSDTSTRNSAGAPVVGAPGAGKANPPAAHTQDRTTRSDLRRKGDESRPQQGSRLRGDRWGCNKKRPGGSRPCP
jgi:hypothetical protein